MRLLVLVKSVKLHDIFCECKETIFSACITQNCKIAFIPAYVLIFL